MDNVGQAATTPSRRKHHLFGRLTDRIASDTRYWWVLLVIGFAWIAIAFAIPRFAYTTIVTIAILVGACCLLAAADEVLVAAVSSRGGRVARGFLAMLFAVAAAVVAFLGVRATVVGLAAVMSVLFICRGAVGVFGAIAAKRERGWPVVLIAGLVELAIGLCIAGSLKSSIMALLTWTAAGTLAHGIGEVALAFLVRRIGRHLATRRA
ncbi:MAG: hypothetical protein JWP83_2047 [Mycobacterium sp.]|jgi:uncharacterized membrane protein HdeD (DUF308 family)|nr:hypothetical protein [Mycobacterium sp.]